MDYFTELERQCPMIAKICTVCATIYGSFDTKGTQFETGLPDYLCCECFRKLGEE